LAKSPKCTANDFAGTKYKAGEIYIYPDNKIQFPETDLKGNRNLHPSRLVLIAHDNLDRNNQLISCFPLSTVLYVKGAFDYVLRKEEVARLDNDSVVIVPLLQPLLKEFLSEFPIARIELHQMDSIRALLLDYLTLLDN